MSTQNFFIIFFYFLTSTSVYAVNLIYDNRFIPLFLPQQIYVDGLRSSFTADMMMATASTAIGSDGREVGIPTIFGDFDLNTLALAIECTGKRSGVRSDFLGRRLPFNTNGRIQAQGGIFRYYNQVSNRLWLGGTAVFMHVDSRQTFQLDTTDITGLTTNDKAVLERDRRKAFEIIGLTENNFSHSGPSDLTLYGRFGDMWEYLYKCRRIWAGLSVGALIPTGVETQLDNAASIPFGGNGFWGMYISGDSLFELKEDIEVGLFFRINKRFTRTKRTRFSVKGEPEIFGALIGSARINPGPTVIFSPHIALKSLRKGFGVEVVYTLTYHGKDSWSDVRADKTIPVDIAAGENVSSWGSDYFTLDVLYDFGKIQKKREVNPIISLKWDIPSQMFVSYRVPKTFKVSLGVELLF